jgi:TfoX/Sxy family transcriptional regulator of competence genes
LAYDEGLAERIRRLLEDQRGITERRMFGGLAFLLRGNMALGIVNDQLMVRVGTETYAAALREPHARAMDFTGRPMKGFVFVSSEGLQSDSDLAQWVEQGIRYSTSLPAKEPSLKALPPEKPRRLTRSAKAERRGPRS